MSRKPLLPYAAPELRPLALLPEGAFAASGLAGEMNDYVVDDDDLGSLF